MPEPRTSTMRAVEATGFGLDTLRLAERPVPRPGPGEILVRVRAATLNYREMPAWGAAAKAAMDGRGADIVVETAGTLAQAIEATAFGGFVGVIGFVGGYRAEVDIRQLIGPMVRLQGIAVGSRTRFEAMNRAIVAHRLKPVVEQIFPLERAAEAFALMERGGQFGKIGLTV